MDRKNLAEKLSSITSEQIFKVMSLIVAIAVGSVGAVLFVYSIHFGGNFSTEQHVWAHFGAYFGGILGPILSFFALMALVLTVVLQSKHVEHAKQDAESSRAALAAVLQQLERSADAQISTSESLAEQARSSAVAAKLSALSAALEAQSEIVRQWQSTPLTAGYDYQAQVCKKEQLAGMILSITDELCKEPSVVG